MPRGYRFLIAALGGLSLLIALGIGSYFGALYSPYQKQYQAVASNQSGQNDYSGPSKSLPDISGLPGPVERAIANPQPATGQDHEIRDLAAQEASALWAFWMVVASSASVLITTVGTIFLYKQIVLTREAVEDTGEATNAMRDSNIIARDSIVSNNRAWLSVDAAINSALVIDENAPELRFSILLTVHNSGGAPATNIDIGVELVMGMAFELGAKQREVAKRSYETGEGGWFPNVTMVPGQSFPQLWSLVTSGEAVEARRRRAEEVVSSVVILPVGVVGCVQYRLPGSPTLHQTGFAYQIELIPTPTRGQAIFESDLPIEASRLRLAIPIGGTGLVD